MDRTIFIALLLLLAGCSDPGVRNLDYFKIGKFDTREGRQALLSKLTSTDETVDVFDPKFRVATGNDADGNAVTAVFYEEKAVKFSIQLKYEIRTQTSNEFKAVEVKYELDKLRRDSLGECQVDKCVIADYNCDYTIIDNAECSVVVHSHDNGDGWFTDIRWSDQAFWRARTNDYLSSVSKKLPD
ncbi:MULTISPECIES: hypothetical protein [Rhizobium]|uniref:Uncharacterized protein n=1 Tax=Rhizobium favelukesii TaxID=348824 RepID=W6R9M7_9HYPH|nr:MULTISPECIES: hypothetical protein [Rhizobium]MCS0460346.1 hypothetical protein [Rhizobium favelukesii]UFS80850.1 hypothetical protein LPB79_21095 [Rhizobium sp. T136]CDM57629.1 putative predicted protein [Rhizobium favelukesii]